MAASRNFGWDMQPMPNKTEIISRFAHYPDADAAVTVLTNTGYPLKDIGIIGDDFRGEPRTAKALPPKRRIRRWALQGVLSGAAIALLTGAAITPPSAFESVEVAGYVSALLVYGADGGLLAGALVWAAALVLDTYGHRWGAERYDRVLTAGQYLLVARGTEEQHRLAKSLIGAVPAEPLSEG